MKGLTWIILKLTTLLSMVSTLYSHMYHKQSTDDLSAETTSQLFEKETSNVTLIGASYKSLSNLTIFHKAKDWLPE